MTIPANKTAKSIEDWKNSNSGHPSDLVDGEIYLQAAPSKEHSAIQGDLRALLQPLRAKKADGGAFEQGKWFFATEIGVIYGQNACTHDLAGWKSERLPIFDQESHIRISPDWVCEIVSTSWRMDTVIKREILERNRVPFYWLISPSEKAVTVLVLEQERYRVFGSFSGEGVEMVHMPPFETLGMKLGDLFNF